MLHANDFKVKQHLSLLRHPLEKETYDALFFFFLTDVLFLECPTMSKYLVNALTPCIYLVGHFTRDKRQQHDHWPWNILG